MVTLGSPRPWLVTPEQCELLSEKLAPVHLRPLRHFLGIFLFGRNVLGFRVVVWGLGVLFWSLELRVANFVASRSTPLQFENDSDANSVSVF